MFIKRVWQKPPILFPLLALFHLFITVHALWLSHDAPLNSMEWLHPLSLILYTFFWIFVCDMRKWAALSYLALTSVNIFLHSFTGKWSPGFLFSDALFPIDILFTFFLLFYFKKFE